MFRFTDTGPQPRGVTLREILGLFRRPEPLPANLRPRECRLHGCGNPALQTGLLCWSHEVGDQIDMYHREQGWGPQ